MEMAGPGMAFAAGGVLGLGYFWVLWAAVRRLPSGRKAALLALASFPVRVALLGSGLLLVAAGGWVHLVAALAGVLAGRALVVHRVRREMAPEGGSPSWS